MTSPLGGHPGSPTAARALVLSERDVLADLEPHWAATIDAATD